MDSRAVLGGERFKFRLAQPISRTSLTASATKGLAVANSERSWKSPEFQWSPESEYCIQHSEYILPCRPPGLKTQKLSGLLCAAQTVVLQIPLFCSPLKLLLCLEIFPPGTGLMAAGPVGTTGTLTGKHSDIPPYLYLSLGGTATPTSASVHLSALSSLHI